MSVLVYWFMSVLVNPRHSHLQIHKYTNTLRFEEIERFGEEEYFFRFFLKIFWDI